MPKFFDPHKPNVPDVEVASDALVLVRRPAAPAPAAGEPILGRDGKPVLTRAGKPLLGRFPARPKPGA